VTVIITEVIQTNIEIKQLVFGFCVVFVVLGASIGGAYATICPDGYLGTVIGTDAENSMFEVQITHEWLCGASGWQPNDTTTEWIFPNDDAMDEICVDDYVEILGSASSGGVIGLGRIKSDMEMVITDIYGDPNFLESYCFLEIRDPPLLGNYTIEYVNTVDCSTCPSDTVVCNCEAKYTNITIINEDGQVEVDGYQLYPGQSHTYEGTECRIGVTFHSGEASANPECTDRPCVGRQPISDFTIHISAATPCNPWDDDGVITVSEIMSAITLWSASTPPAEGCDLLTVSDIMAMITTWSNQS
jgi:hypothetical protein